MNARLLALAAGLPFVLGVTVGATAAPITAADAADQPMAAMTQMHDADPATMDAMHAAMADQMPAKLRETCDAMHSAMAAGEMPMGDAMRADMPNDHAAHHR